MHIQNFTIDSRHVLFKRQKRKEKSLHMGMTVTVSVNGQHFAGTPFDLNTTMYSGDQPIKAVWEEE